MRRLLLCLAALCVPFLVAVPAASAGWYPSEAIDGPNPDVIGVTDVEVSRDGTGAMVYLKRDGGVPHVFLSRLVEGAWRAPERVDVGIPAAATEAVVATADGHRTAIAFVAGGQVFGSVIEFSPDGRLQGPTLLHPEASVRDVAIDMSINGTAYVTFSAPGGGGSDIRAVRLKDAVWEPVAAPLDIDPARSAGAGESRARVGVSAEGYAVAAWGEDGIVYGRRITGLNLSVAPQRVSLGDLGGTPGGAAGSVDLDIEDDGSYAWVLFRQDFGGASRTIARRLVGSLFEAPTAIDGGNWCANPKFEMTGRGVGVGVCDSGDKVVGSVLDRDQFAPGARLDAQGGTGPVVASSERETAAVAWLTAGNLKVRHKPMDKPFSPEYQVSRPDFGAVVPGAYAISGSRLDDYALAMTQGPEGARAITVADYDRPPGAPFARETSRYVRSATPTLKYRGGIDLWGPQTFKIEVDGVEVGQTQSTSGFTLTTPLPDGLHKWRVVAIDRRGQQVASRTRYLRVDSVLPTAKIKLSGRRKVGQALKLSVSAKDQKGGSGINRVTVNLGDGSKTVRMGKTLALRYRRSGTFTLVVNVTDKAGNVLRDERTVKISK